jgi:23S rRNA G2445 N2-methylase RlmL
LYKRGYKESNTEASLAENLAAALLQLAGWTNEKFSAENTVFCDPLVGSGTLLTEVSSA